MRHFKISYRKINNCEVWIEAIDALEAENKFMRDFDRYDGESDSLKEDMEIMLIYEIDENGNWKEKVISNGN